MVPLPVWKRKGKKHAAKRKGNYPAPATDKKTKLDEESPEKCSPVRRVRLLSDFEEEERSRKVLCVSNDERAKTPEPRSGSTLSVPELDSIVTVRSQINLREVQETENIDSVMKELVELISEPSESKELSGDLSSSKPRVGMSSGTRKSFRRSTPKIS